MNRKFNFRALTTFITTWTFLLLILSGTVLFVSPAGRISNWTNWRLLALTKAQWQGVHILTAILFLISGLFHLLKFNWKVFLTHMRTRAGAGRQYRWELAASILLVLAVFAGTVQGLPPFVTITAAGEAVKNSWSTSASEPPVPHTELLSVKQVAQNLKLQPEEAVATLAKKGVQVQAVDESLSAAAKRAGVSPSRIYSELKATSPVAASLPPAVVPEAHSPTAGGAGYGLKTLAQIAAELGLTPAEVIERLGRKQIQAESGETLRNIAQRHNLRPFELVEQIKTP